MPLAIFDLDNTLIAGDSDHLWGEFLVEHSLVDAEYFKQKNDEFYQNYVDGNLDIHDYIAFSLSPLKEHSMEALSQLHNEFMATHIEPIMLDQAKALIKQHEDNGDTLLVITATNRFVTEPIVKAFGIEHLLAIELEVVDGRYTGKSIGVPSFKDGKVTRLKQWLKEHPHDLSDAFFYSDSHNDIPLLNLVGKPVVVDGDEQLLAHGTEHNWKITSLRNE